MLYFWVLQNKVLYLSSFRRTVFRVLSTLLADRHRARRVGDFSSIWRFASLRSTQQTRMVAFSEKCQKLFYLSETKVVIG